MGNSKSNRRREVAPVQENAARDLELLKQGDTPIRLESATTELMELASMGSNALCDILANDTSENYRAVMAALRLCRAAIDELEVLAKENLAREAAYHRERLQDIESLGVLVNGQVPS